MQKEVVRTNDKTVVVAGEVVVVRVMIIVVSAEICCSAWNRLVEQTEAHVVVGLLLLCGMCQYARHPIPYDPSRENDGRIVVALMG